MAFQTEIPVTTEGVVEYLTQQFGTEVGTQQLLSAADEFRCSFATIKKRLKAYKASAGKWNLTVAEAREVFEKQITKELLVPSKDDTYVPFGNFNSVKKIIIVTIKITIITTLTPPGIKLPNQMARPVL